MWLGGLPLADGVWDIIKKYVPKNKRKQAAEELIDLFENSDCGSMDDAIMFDTAFPDGKLDEEKETFYEPEEPWQEKASELFGDDEVEDDEDDENEEELGDEEDE